MTLTLTLDFGTPTKEVEFGTTKLGDGVLLGKLVDAFLKIWPIIAPILLTDGTPKIEQ